MSLGHDRSKLRKQLFIEVKARFYTKTNHFLTLTKQGASCTRDAFYLFTSLIKEEKVEVKFTIIVYLGYEGLYHSYRLRKDYT